MKQGAGQHPSNTCRLPLTEAERVDGKPEKPHTMSDITWRIFRIMSEFVEGFQFLSELSREVTIFGSARTSPDSKWYQEAEKLGLSPYGDNGKEEYKSRVLELEQKSLDHLEIDWEVKFWGLKQIG